MADPQPGLFDDHAKPPAGVPVDVANKFEELAIKVASRGFKRFSARMILHQIRWFEKVEHGRNFKVNNLVSRPLADWFMTKWPAYGKFFETRDRRESSEGGDE
jgi:hypothetical protein